MIVIRRMKLMIRGGGGEEPVWQIQEQIGDCQLVFTKPQKRSFDKSLIHLSADWFVPEVGPSPGHPSLGSWRLKICVHLRHIRTGTSP